MKDFLNDYMETGDSGPLYVLKCSEGHLWACGDTTEEVRHMLVETIKGNEDRYRRVKLELHQRSSGWWYYDAVVVKKKDDDSTDFPLAV